MTWESLEEFHDWYLVNKMPMAPPENYEVILSDDATAVCLFREGQFQVEAYLIHPKPLVQIHEHPGVEVIKMRIYSNGDRCSEPVLRNGQYHGHGFRVEGEKNGFILYAIQKWDEDLSPTTVAARWRGKTVGPMQEALIKKFYPEAFVLDGYADVTKTMDYLEELRHAKSA